jgi:hypothetical protein
LQLHCYGGNCKKQYDFIIKSGYRVEINNNEPYASAKGDDN